MKSANLEIISELLYGLKQKSGMRGLGWGMLVTGHGANLEEQRGVGEQARASLCKDPAPLPESGFTFLLLPKNPPSGPRTFSSLVFLIGLH